MLTILLAIYSQAWEIHTLTAFSIISSELHSHFHGLGRAV